MNPNRSTSQSQERQSQSNQPQTFSPTNTQQFSNFFSQKGPIKPQSLVQSNSSGPTTQNVKPPSVQDFIKPNDLQSQQQLAPFMQGQDPKQSHYQQFRQHQQNLHSEDDYYDEEDEAEVAPRQSRTILSPEEEQQILARLRAQAQKNPEFQKVVAILQNDPELKPLIFEHDVLLHALTDMKDMKAEYMLSILTAAETEMYESSKIKEELQSQCQTQQDMIDALQKKLSKDSANSTQQVIIPKPQSVSKEVSVNMETPQQQDPEKLRLLQLTQTSAFEITQLKKDLTKIQEENLNLTLELNKERDQRQELEREKECTFKNLYDENQQLKKANETLKKNETEVKRQLENKEREFKLEIDSLRTQLRQQEDLRSNMLQNKSRLEIDLQQNQQLMENLAREINLLEKENENLYRKLNSTYNSVMFQSRINQQFIQDIRDQNQSEDQQLQQLQNLGNDGTPTRRNLSTSFQYTGIIDKKESFIGQPAFSQSTHQLKLQMSENSKSIGGSNAQSFIAHSIYYGLGVGLGGAQKDKYFNQGGQFVRSNSIDVILLDEEEAKQQTTYQMEEERKSQVSGIMTNKQSWLRTRPLFTDLSPINSISSQQMEQSTNRQNQQRMRKLHDVEEEQTEILGTNPNTVSNPYPGVKYYEELVKKMQQEMEKLKEEINQLTQKNMLSQQIHFGMRTEESGQKGGTFATPQNTGYIMQGRAMLGSDAREDAFASQERQIISNINPMGYNNEQSPIMMATFSKEKERPQFYSQRLGYHNSAQSSLPNHQHSESEREKFLEQQFEKLSNEFGVRLQEIGSRLINVYKKFQPQPNELGNYMNQEFNVSLIKDLIYDIAVKFDAFLEVSNHSRVKSGGVFSQMGTQPHYYMPQSFSGMGNISTTLDIAEMKNMVLEEKERRLHAMEELQRTKEHVMRFQTENEKLKQELYFEKHNSHEYQVNEQTIRNLTNLQGKYEQLQDENVTLKLKASELESELMEVRQKQQIKYDFSIENLKNNMNTQYLEYKMGFEQQIMSLKTEKSNLTQELQGLAERNLILKEQIAVYRERINELERDNLFHSKENYILQNELDYESLRVSQLQTKKDNQKSFNQTQMTIEKQRLEDVIAKQDQKLKDLQFAASDWEMKAKRTEDTASLQVLRLENEIKFLQGEKRKLEDDLRKQINLNQKSADTLQVEKSQQTQIKAEFEKKRAAQKLVSLLNHRNKLQEVKGYVKMQINVIREKYNQEKAKLGESMKSLNLRPQSEDNSRVQVLEEQLYKVSTVNQSMAKLIGKILRNVNAKLPIKLSMQGLVSKMTLDFILYGLKRNSEVYELNLSKCDLDDEDLAKVVSVLEQDQGIGSLKIAKNNFISSLLPLLGFLETKGDRLKVLDISQQSLDVQTIQRIPKVFTKLQNLEELNLSGMINSQLGQIKDQVNMLLQGLLRMRNLKALDLSKNKFSKESMIVLFQSLGALQNLQSLALSQCHITDESNIVSLISQLKQLKRLNISGNQDISSNTLGQMLSQLKTNGVIEEIDLSRCNVSGCVQALASLISGNVNLRVLTIIKAGLNDKLMGQLVSPLSENLNLETIKLDFNNFGSQFIQNWVSRMVVNPLGKYKRSLHHDSFDELPSNDDMSQTSNMKRSQQKDQGLMFVSLEGNNIGDLGAITLAKLIMTPNENTKQLRSMNLNECGISNEGFEALKDALTERGNLTQNMSLSHVKITIERNNITY